MDKIQEKITEKRGRNRLSRVLHAKSDKDAVAAWKLDLNRILHVFNVRSVASIWSSLTGCVQTELAVNTNVVVSDIRRDVVMTQTIVSDVHQGVVDTQAIVSDIHRAVVKGQDEAVNQHISVNITCTTSIAQSILTIH